MSNWKSINTIYLYDGSFNGLLTVVLECLQKKVIPFDIVSNDYETNLFHDYLPIATNHNQAKKVYDAILQNISQSTLYFVHRAFLANDSKKDLCILKYLLLGFKLGAKVEHLLTDANVSYVQLLSKKVLGESHRFFGLLRFMDLGNNLFYSKIHPEHNILEILGNHFMNRFPNQNFIIHDKNRNLALLYNTKTYTIIEAKDIPIKLSKEEKYYQNLWKTFYHTIAIAERYNPKLQMQCMPKKYWQDLI